MNFLYDHEWVLEWSKMLDFRLSVGSGTSNGMQVFQSLICIDKTLVTSICTSNPVLKSDSTYPVENYNVSSSILSALFVEWKNCVWYFFKTLKKSEGFRQDTSPFNSHNAWPRQNFSLQYYSISSRKVMRIKNNAN